MAMPNIMGLFRPAPAPAAPVVGEQGNQGNPAGAKPGDGLGAGKNPQSGDQPGLGGEQKNQETQVVSPLDKFKDIWQPPKSEGNPAGGEGNPLAGKDGKTPTGPNYVEIGNKLDFARLIPQDVMTKALGGDIGAFSTVINLTSRAAFAAAAKMADSSISTAIKDSEGRINGSLPARFKEFSLSDSSPKNPALSHPAVRPMVEAIKSQFATKFPDATTEELTKMSEDYVGAMFSEIGKGSPETVAAEQKKVANSRTDLMKRQESGEFDWNTEFFGTPSQ